MKEDEDTRENGQTSTKIFNMLYAMKKWDLVSSNERKRQKKEMEETNTYTQTY